MAGFSKSAYLQKMVLGAALRGGIFTPPTNLFLALSTADFGESGAGVEISASSYARRPISFDPPVDATGGSTGASCASSADVQFATATEDWTSGTDKITHGAIFDAASGGNMLYYGPLSVPKEIKTGDRMTFDQGNVIVTED